MPDPAQGDRVSYGIDFTPWLDGPCPAGSPVGVRAALEGIARAGEPGLTVRFTDLSTPGPGCDIANWEWDFGDGATSTERNPSHTYDREGVYDVRLCVEDGCGSTDCVTMRDYITIGEGAAQQEAGPAMIGVSNLVVEPAQVAPDGEVTISADVCNQGAEDGILTVTLMVDGSGQQSQSVSVSAGACRQVIFTTAKSDPGTYQVTVEGMTGQFAVLDPGTSGTIVPPKSNTGPGTWGIIAIVAAGIVLIVVVVFIFRRI